MATDTKPTDHQSQYGDVTYADPKNHKYPINNESRVRAAWSYINMPKNQKGYTPEEVASIKAKIKAAGKKYGIQFSDDGDGDGGGDGGNGNGRSAPGDDIERRNTLNKVELRSMTGSGREIGGYAAMFGRESRQLGTFIEVVAPSFFNKSHADGWPGMGAGVICRYNHDDFHLLGSTRSGTLRLTLNETGLDYTVDVPQTRQDVLELVTRGDVCQSSMAMIVTQDQWGHTASGAALRTLVEGKLVDVSPVITPAYPSTTVALRSLARDRGVPVDEVVELAEKEELRKLFIRTDTGAAHPPMSGARARMYMMGKRPRDPIKRGR
jgi:HK97 family phage prohead protease